MGRSPGITETEAGTGAGTKAGTGVGTAIITNHIRCRIDAIRITGNPTSTAKTRLARSTRDLLNVLDAVSRAGATFKSLADTWADTTTSHGRLMLTVLGGLAQFERELIKARTDEGRKRAIAKGVQFGRPVKLTPYQRREAVERHANGNHWRRSASRLTSAINPSCAWSRRRHDERGSMSKVGDLNRNGQELLAKTDAKGTDHNQKIWALQCSGCGHVYGANGSDFHQRKCPKCQGGAPGI
jgi:hypothetical protein